MRVFIVFILFLFSVMLVPVMAQVTFVVVSLPDYTPPEDHIYIAGNFNSWNPGNAQHVLNKNEDNLYEITLNGIPDGQIIEFKFTRGNWETVERGEQGEEIPNRIYTLVNGETVNISIHNWADGAGSGGGDSIAAENVYVVDDAFYMPQLNRSRSISIYLPPGYENSGLSYPVIYMQDGQNLFEELPDWDEMKIDETLNSLSDQGYNVPIVVGIANGEHHRANEYLPYYFAPLNAGGEGDAYMQFIVESLKPYIDEHYRTLTDREHTGIMGSSFGGLISWYGAVKYQDVFSKCGVFSPAYWANYNNIMGFLSEKGFQQDVRFYQNVGENEDANQYIHPMYQMEASLISHGFEHVFSKVIPNGNHWTSDWAADFEAAYLWLFSDYAVDIDSTPTLVTPPFYHGFDNNEMGLIRLTDIAGIQAWETAAFGTPAPCAKMSGYNGSANIPNEDWMILPGFDFSSVTHPVLQFDEAINFGNAIETEQTVLISTDYSGIGNPAAATWTTLQVNDRAAGNDWTFVTVSPIELSSFAGEPKVYVAFKYISTTNSAATWEIDNISITLQTVANEKPQISSILTNPLSPTIADAVHISATVTDIDGTIESVVLDWGVSSGSLTNQIAMSKGTGDVFTTSYAIPAQPEGSTVYYQMTATDDDSESTNSDELSYTILTGISNLHHNSKMALYPNPAKTHLYIEFGGETNSSVSIFDLHGRKIGAEINPVQKWIDISNLADGVYILRLVNQNGAVIKQFVKR